jgi:hypothetical protein
MYSSREYFPNLMFQNSCKCLISELSYHRAAASHGLRNL